MKKLVGILMSVVALNAYALPDTLKIENNTVQDIAVECFPSGHYCNGVGNGYTCTCEQDDATLYVGRVGLPQTEAQLDTETVYGYHFSFNDKDTGLHILGDGHVWKIWKDLTSTLWSYETCQIGGDPVYNVDCTIESPN